MAKSRAKSKGLTFNLDSAYVVDLWRIQNGSCAVTKQPFALEKFGEKGQVHPFAPSIDRINPRLGYTKGNIRLIIYHLNIALSDFGQEQFELLLKLYQNGRPV